jgi:hypothetical protein
MRGRPCRDRWCDLFGAGRPELVRVAEDRHDADGPAARRDCHPHIGRGVADVCDCIRSILEAEHLESTPERCRVGLVDHEVVAEDADG